MVVVVWCGYSKFYVAAPTQRRCGSFSTSVRLPSKKGPFLEGKRTGEEGKLTEASLPCVEWSRVCPSLARTYVLRLIRLEFILLVERVESRLL